MKALTKVQLIEAHERDLVVVRANAFLRGREEEKATFKYDREAAKLQQLQAAAKLMEEITRAASRIGYMIGKINGDNAR